MTQPRPAARGGHSRPRHPDARVPCLADGLPHTVQPARLWVGVGSLGGGGVIAAWGAGQRAAGPTRTDVASACAWSAARQAAVGLSADHRAIGVDGRRDTVQGGRSLVPSRLRAVSPAASTRRACASMPQRSPPPRRRPVTAALQRRPRLPPPPPAPRGEYGEGHHRPTASTYGCSWRRRSTASPMRRRAPGAAAAATTAQDVAASELGVYKLGA